MKKLKLFATISTMCLALAVLCFGVFSATQVTYTIGGSISYEVNDVFADVKTRVYSSSFKDKSTLSTKVSTLAESGDVSDLTDTAYKYDFATTGDSQSFDNTEGGTKEGIKIEYNTTNKRTYFIVVSIKNRADNTISASISGKGLSSGANTVFIKSNAIASLTNKEEEKRLVMAFMLDNIYTATNGPIDFEYTISMGNLGNPAGSVNITNKASNFETSQFESKLNDNIIASTSYNFTLTSSNKQCDALKMDLTSNSNTEKMVDITLTYDIKAGYAIFILTEEVMNELLNQLSKTLKELTDEEWNNLIKWAAIMTCYEFPGSNNLNAPTRNDFKYPANKVKSTGSSYYILICASEDVTSDISGSLQIDITNIQDYRDDVYTLSADGTYYEFTKLNNKELTEYEVASTYGDNNLPVKVIGNNAFKDTKISKITMPDSITELGINIFFGCTITRFEVPRQVTNLVGGTFSGANFGTLTIPSTVKSIEMYAISDTATWMFGGTYNIENMIVKCDYSAFKGDITNADFDYTKFEIKNMTIYTNKLWDWLSNRSNGYGYITGSLYVKAEYLETMKTTYADSYLVTNNLIKAMA